jgi:hypothetical protein
MLESPYQEEGTPASSNEIHPITSLEKEGKDPEMRKVGRAIDRILATKDFTPESLTYLKGLIRTFAMLNM